MIDPNRHGVFILTFIFTSLCFGADIFVDNQLADDCIGTYSIANRDCSGSDGDAYSTPQEAADVVQPGDTVYFREGVYYQHEDLRDAAVVMNILRSGTPSNPITFKNYNNEEAVFSGMRPGNDGHHRTVTLGIEPSDNQDISGQGVQNIIIDGLIVEGASVFGLAIFGPANRLASAENPAENVIIRNVIVRHNSGDPYAGGMTTKGKLVNILIENCEVYNNTGSGILFGRMGFSHESEPEDDMNAAQHCVVRNCLSYNNVNPPRPGGADGMVGTHMYRCTFEDNILFGNDDDGIDMLASIECTAKNNISFNHPGPGDGNGLKFSVQGGGRHTVCGNVVFNNKNCCFEGSDPGGLNRAYYPSRIYGNLGYNSTWGIALGTSYTLTYPGFEKVYLRDNLVLENSDHDIRGGLGSTIDSDYNFISNSDDFNKMQSWGLDAHSLTGDPQLANKEVVIDTNFDPAWSIEVKLNHIRSQVKAAFSPLVGSIVVDAGIVIDGYHNPDPGDGAGDGTAWYGDAPDMGAYDYVPADPNWQYVLSISSTSGGLTNPGEGDHTYYGETVVSLQAMPDENYQFVNWTGTAVNAGKVANPNGASTTVTVDGDYTIQANFALGEPHDLMISSTLGGMVTTPGEGTYVYEHGTVVSVVAAPGANHQFVNWTGTAVDAGKLADPGSASTTVTVGADYTLRANFSIDRHNLTISSTAGGAVTTPGEGPFEYDHGTVVSVAASSEANYHFVNWTGTAVDAGKVANPNVASTTVTMDADYTLQANFSIDQHNLTISSTAGGTVTTPGEGTYVYDHGTAASVVATPEADYYFVNWTGTAVNAGKVANPNAASTTVTADADYTVRANFGQQDGIAPTVTNRSPDVDDTQVPVDSLIILHVTDTGLGVKASSVIITLEGHTIYQGDVSEYSSPTGICRRMGTPADFTYAYQSSQPFDFDQSKTVTVNAIDIGEIGMTESYSFVTEMRSFGENKKVSLGIDNLASAGPATVRDSGGNIWVVWHAGPTGGRDVYVGKLADGADSFDASLQLAGSVSDKCNPAIAIDGSGKIWVTWQGDDPSGNWDIFVSTSINGTNWSNPVQVNSGDPNNDSDQTSPAIAIDGNNKAYVTWEDGRAGNKDIWVATSTDATTWTSAQITTHPSDQSQPTTAIDASNIAYLVWTDRRNGSDDIYGAASNSDPCWANVAVVTGAGNQSFPAMAAEAAGSVLHFAWVDDAAGNRDIHYAFSDAMPASPVTGINIIDNAGATEQTSPAITTVGSTGDGLGVFVCWQDKRNLDTDLYFVEVRDGTETNVLVGDDGTNGSQSEPAIGVGIYGHPYLVWTDNRASSGIYYAGSTFSDPTPLQLADVNVSVGATVGPETVEDLTDVSVRIPPRAYPCDLRITISSMHNLPELPSGGFGVYYGFGPGGLNFNPPVTITIPHEADDCPDLPIYRAYWYNTEIGDWSTSGITNVKHLDDTDPNVATGMHAVQFDTTHFTIFGVSASAGAPPTGGGGGGGGGCSISPTADGSIVEFLLPYLGLAAVIVMLRFRDRKRRQVIARKPQR